VARPYPEGNERIEINKLFDAFVKELKTKKTDKGIELYSGIPIHLLIDDINEIVGADPRVYPTQIELNEYEQGFIVELTLNLKNTNQSSTLRLAFDQSVGLQVQ
jgi:hypothetical protein